MLNELISEDTLMLLRIVLFAIATLAASSMSPAQPTKDNTDEPLPEGAKLRLGTTRLRSEFGWPAGTLTPDGKHIAVNKSFKMILLDVTTGREAGELETKAATLAADSKRAAVTKVLRATKRQFSNVAIEPISFSADGKLIAVGAEGGFNNREPLTAIVWNVDGEKQIAEVKPEQNLRIGVRLSPDGKTLATFGQHNDPQRKFDARNPNGWPEQAVQLWNVEDGKLLARFAVTGFAVSGLAFSPDGSLVAASGGNGVVWIRDARTGKEKHQLFGRSYMGYRLAFSPDGKTLAAAARDGRIQRWNVADGKFIGSTESPPGPRHINGLILKELLFTAPDRAVAWGARGLVAVVWEVPSGKILSPTNGLYERVTSVAFTADGKQVVTVSADAAVTRWNATTGEQLPSAFVRPEWDNSSVLPEVQLLPGAARGFSARSGSSLYDLTTRTELFRLPVREGSRGPGHIVRLTDDGTKALTRTFAGDKEKADTYEVWNLLAPKKLGEVEAPRADTATAGVASDGTKLFVFAPKGFEDRVLTGYDVTTGKPLDSTPVPGGMSAFAIPGKEPLVLVTTKPGKLLVIDYATGKTVRTVDTGRAYLSTAPAFSPDGKLVAVPYGEELVGKKFQKPELRVYSWPAGELQHTFTGHTTTISALAFSPDSKILASGSHDTTVLLWDVSK